MAFFIKFQVWKERIKLLKGSLYVIDDQGVWKMFLKV